MTSFNRACGTPPLNELVTDLPSELNGFRIAGQYSPAFDVGGDFYGFAASPEGEVTLVIGDVCGRGAPAASWLQVIRPEVTRLCNMGISPARLLEELNAFGCTRLPDSIFVTAAALRLDAKGRQMIMSNAGHVPAMIRSATPARLVGAASGPPLGMVANAHYEEEFVALEPGDLIVLMTDGVLEAIEEDLVHMPNLLSMLGAQPGHAEQVTQNIFNRVRRTLRRPDDVTLLSVEFECAAQNAAQTSARRRTASGVN